MKFYTSHKQELIKFLIKIYRFYMNFLIKYVQIFYENLKLIKILQDLKRCLQNLKDFVFLGTYEMLYELTRTY